MKICISVSVDEVLKKPVEDWDDKDESALDEAKEKLPRKKKEVVLPPEEAHVDNLPNAEPVKHTVKKGETLKKIAEQYSVSYGELSNRLMETEGTAAIYPGQVIEIPRHFIDLSKA